MAKHIVFVDCDQIQRYITSSGRLRDIRGASARLAWVNETATEALLPKAGADEYPRLLFSAGGITKAVFTDGCQAKAFERGIRGLYNEELPGVGVTTHIESFEGKEGGNLAAANRAGEKEIRRRKDDRRDVRTVVSSPYFAACEACGQEPAEHVYDAEPGVQKGQDLPLLCTGCLRKRGTREYRGRPTPKAWSESPLVEFQSRLCCELAKVKGRPVNLPPDFAGVADPAGVPFEEDAKEDAHDTSNYVALICADGNDMGRIGGEVLGSAPERFHEFSRAVKGATAEALRQAAEAVLGDAIEEGQKGKDGEPRKLIIPFQPLILGGDDIVCVVQADRALALATEFIRSFVKLTAADPVISDAGIYGKPISIAAGVAIAKCKYPFYDLHELAEDLLREAKAKCRALEGNTCAVSFHVISSPRAPDFETIRQRHATSCRPYLVGECAPKPTAEGLVEAVRILKSKDVDFPRSKISALPEIVKGERGPEYQQWLHGMREEHRKVWEAACAALDRDPVHLTNLTFAADLNEIYGFVSVKGGEHAQD